MLFGLGFFIFVMNTIRKDDREYYDRKLNEAREFGYQESKLHREATKPRRKLF